MGFTVRMVGIDIAQRVGFHRFGQSHWIGWIGQRAVEVYRHR
jgi:hypothetical protein